MEAKQTVIEIPHRLGKKRIEFISNMNTDTIQYFFDLWTKEATRVTQHAFIQFVKSHTIDLHGVFIYSPKEWKNINMKYHLN